MSNNPIKDHTSLTKNELTFYQQTLDLNNSLTSLRQSNTSRHNSPINNNQYYDYLPQTTSTSSSFSSSNLFVKAKKRLQLNFAQNLSTLPDHLKISRNHGRRYVLPSISTQVNILPVRKRIKPLSLESITSINNHNSINPSQNNAIEEAHNKPIYSSMRRLNIKSLSSKTDLINDTNSKNNNNLTERNNKETILSALNGKGSNNKKQGIQLKDRSILKFQKFTGFNSNETKASSNNLKPIVSSSSNNNNNMTINQENSQRTIKESLPVKKEEELVYIDSVTYTVHKRYQSNKINEILELLGQKAEERKQAEIKRKNDLILKEKMRLQELLKEKCKYTFKIEQTQMNEHNDNTKKTKSKSKKIVRRQERIRTMSAKVSSDSNDSNDDDNSEKENKIKEKYQQVNKTQSEDEDDDNDNDNDNSVPSNNQDIDKDNKAEGNDDTNAKPAKKINRKEYTLEVQELSKLFLSECYTKIIAKRHKKSDKYTKIRKDLCLNNSKAHISTKYKMRTLVFSISFNPYTSSIALEENDSLMQTTIFESDFLLQIHDIIIHNPSLKLEYSCTRHLLDDFLKFGQEEVNGFILTDDRKTLTRRNAMNGPGSKNLTMKQYKIQEMTNKAMTDYHNISQIQKFFSIDYLRDQEHSSKGHNKAKQDVHEEIIKIKKLGLRRLENKTSKKKRKRVDFNLLKNPEIYTVPTTTREHMMILNEKIMLQTKNLTMNELSLVINALLKQPGDLRKSLHYNSCFFYYLRLCILNMEEQLFISCWRKYCSLFNMNFQDENGDTLLILACKMNRKMIIRFLITQRIDLNLQNRYRNTALHYAVAHKHFEIVNMLITHGASESLTNNYDKTAWECTVEFCENDG